LPPSVPSDCIGGESEIGAGDTIHATLWHRGRITDLGTLGGRFSSARAINDNGVIVGRSDTAAGETHAVLWRNGAMTDLGTLGGAYSEAHAINKAEQVVGVSTTAGGAWHAFLWQAGAMIDLGALPDPGDPNLGFHSSALGINEAGIIAGIADAPDGFGRAVIWQAGEIVDLGGAPGGQGSSAMAVNGAGQIVGSSNLGRPGLDPTHATLWTVEYP
jgi:probable HAF family extracellular repeat protein